MTKETEKKLNQKAVYTLLENFASIISTSSANDHNLESIQTAIDYTLMITKATHDIADHTYISRYADLLDNTNDGEAEDYLIVIYNEQLQNLGVKV